MNAVLKRREDERAVITEARVLICGGCRERPATRVVEAGPRCEVCLAAPNRRERERRLREAAL